MMKFLLQSSSNKAWVENQERLHNETLKLSMFDKAVRAELYPELQLASAQRVRRDENASEMLLMARQRQKIKEVLRELSSLAIFDNNIDHGYNKKQTNDDLSYHGTNDHRHYFSTSKIALETKILSLPVYCIV